MEDLESISPSLNNDWKGVELLAAQGSLLSPLEMLAFLCHRGRTQVLLVCFLLVPPYNLQGYHPKSAMSVTSQSTHALVPSGTLTSITNLATSLARNMDRLSLDEEHYNRQEEWRRQLPESLGEGLRQGLSRLGISLLGKGLWHSCLSSPSSASSPGNGHGAFSVGVVRKFMTFQRQS